MKEASLHRHFQQQHATLFTVGIALGFAVLASRVPLLHGWQDWGLFFATFVVLVHWHYGGNYVLWHVGPSSDPVRTLWDGGILMLLLALPMSLQNPVVWYLAVGATYFFAWVKYSVALRQARYQGELRRYMERKSVVEVLAFGLCWIGAATQKILPEGGAVYAWVTVVVNFAFLWLMTRHFGFYRMGWSDVEWDLGQAPVGSKAAKKGRRR